VGDPDGDYVGGLGGSMGTWVTDRVDVDGVGLSGKASAHCVEFGCRVGCGGVGCRVKFYVPG
jgi:hypothetical protein